MGGITQCRHLLIGPTPLVRTEQRLLESVGARTEGIFWTIRTLRVEPVVAVVRPAGVVGIEPRPARLALLADHVARGVALLLHVTNQPWISSVDLYFSNSHIGVDIDLLY